MLEVKMWSKKLKRYIQTQHAWIESIHWQYTHIIEKLNNYSMFDHLQNAEIYVQPSLLWDDDAYLDSEYLLSLEL